MTVVLGGNRFVDCQVIVALNEQPVLRVVEDPLAIELTLPNGVLSTVPLTQLKSVRSENAFGVFLGDDALVLATRLDPGTVHLKVDLRPGGLDIYDDGEGLHIAGNTYGGNVVKSAGTAINLA